MEKENFEQNKLFEKLVEDNKEIWDSYVNHKIKKGLVNEEISIDVFKKYIQQDYLYIFAYKKYIEMLFDETKLEIFGSLASSCDMEHLLHKQYTNDLENIIISDETKNYISYFDEVFKEGTVEEKIVALAPCFIGYAMFGRNIYMEKIDENNKYREWIEAYNSQEYMGLVYEYIDMLNDIGINDTYKKLSKIFGDVSRLEVEFFNQMLK